VLGESPDAVHMAGDQVAPETVTDPKRTLEVNLAPRFEASEGRAGARLGRGIAFETIRENGVHRQADPIDRDRLSQGEGFGFEVDA
jgi:hypothetical protein